MKRWEAITIMGILSAFFGLFGCKDASIPDNAAMIHVTAQLNHLLMPLDRGERYEDPLDDALEARNLGETTGGGTMQLASGEIEFIDIEIDLTDLDVAVPFVIEQLEALGAPKGSKLIIHDTEPPREVPFGKAEGVAVYLDGVGLPDEVYASSDVNIVIEELKKRLGAKGAMHGYWHGPTETALYFYGRDAEEMKRLMSDFLQAYPLCKDARVVTIAPRS